MMTEYKVEFSKNGYCRTETVPAAVISESTKQYNEPLMVPGFGAQPVHVKEWVAANDNVATKVGGKVAGGQYIGLRRHLGEVPGENERAEGWFDRGSYGESAPPAELATTTFGPLEEYHSVLYSPPARTGDFMQTYTGRKFWPVDPKADEVFIEDIAHSLSLQCRYAGHCHQFYSVAEHSVLMARKLRWEGGVEAALWALMHDASEAYLVDIPRPVKPSLIGYKEAEARVMAAICGRFSLGAEMPAIVHEYDTRIIGDELVNMAPMDWHARYDNPIGVTLKYWSPAKAEAEFLATFAALMDGRAGELRRVAA